MKGGESSQHRRIELRTRINCEETGGESEENEGLLEVDSVKLRRAKDASLYIDMNYYFS
jgi:hypothetical protein